MEPTPAMAVLHDDAKCYGAEFQAERMTRRFLSASTIVTIIGASDPWAAHFVHSPDGKPFVASVSKQERLVFSIHAASLPTKSKSTSVIAAVLSFSTTHVKVASIGRR